MFPAASAAAFPQAQALAVPLDGEVIAGKAAKRADDLAPKRPFRCHNQDQESYLM
jgi:hypothetical protein